MVRDYIEIVNSTNDKELQIELAKNTKSLLQALPDDVLSEHLTVAADISNGGFYRIELKIPFGLIMALLVRVR